MARVLFITAPYHAGVVEVAGRWLPLYFVTLAGAVRAAGHEVLIFDAMTKGLGQQEIGAAIRRCAPDVVAVSLITATAPDGLAVLATAKEVDESIVTVAGGVHATFLSQQILESVPAVDYVICGEGEETLVALLACLEGQGDLAAVAGLAFRRTTGNVAHTPARALRADLDGMPMAWDLLDWQDYTYHILPGSRLGAIATSRGCEHRCAFCSQQRFWRRTWRGRSPADVVRELEVLHHEYGVDVVLLTDDYPTPDRARWEAILDLLIARRLPLRLLMETRASDIVRDRDILAKYRRAGVIHIYVGTEATDQARLDHFCKDVSVDEAREALRLCRRHGIITETSFILGLPEETPESVRRTIDLAIDYDPDFAHFLAIAPWPYADIYPQLAPYIEVEDFRKYNLVEPIVRPRAMSRQEVDAAIVEGYRRFYQAKMAALRNDGDSFRRQYIETAFLRIMRHSFIRAKLGIAGGAEGMNP